MKRVLVHARLCAAQAFDGGIFYVASGYVLRLLKLIFLLFLWRQLLSGREESFTVDQLLTYTLFSALFAQQLDIHTSASEDFWKGDYGMHYLKPMSVYWQIAIETVGRWVPGWACFSIPALLLALLMGVPIAPYSPAHGACAALSLLLSMSLGFCVDFLFMTLGVAMRNATYQAQEIRFAVTTICSGALIPFAVMPYGLGDVFALLPFGALAGAPLAIYTGLQDVGMTLLLQVFWNLLLWPLCLLSLKKSEERMISHGG